MTPELEEEKVPLLIFYKQGEKIGVEFGRDENIIKNQLELIGFLHIFIDKYKEEITLDVSDDEDGRHFTH